MKSCERAAGDVPHLEKLNKQSTEKYRAVCREREDNSNIFIKQSILYRLKVHPHQLLPVNKDRSPGSGFGFS